MTGRPRPGDYARQARTYDRTRSASPSVLRRLLEGLGPGGGRSLLDVAAGTGNYSRGLRDGGFAVLALDVEIEMLRRSVGKIGPGRQVVADAARLPLAGEAVDAAVLVSALHLMAEPAAALAEARRVIRSGPFVLQAFTRENMAPIFLHEYFAGTEGFVAEHAPADDLQRWLLQAGFSSVRRDVFVYRDTFDGSLAALHTDADRLADPVALRNNSWFNRLGTEALHEGLGRVAAALASGELARRVEASRSIAERTGHGTVFTALP